MVDDYIYEEYLQQKARAREVHEFVSNMKSMNALESPKEYDNVMDSTWEERLFEGEGPGESMYAPVELEEMEINIW